MKQYNEYKDSGVKWIGEIPSHWGIESFGRHFSYGKGLLITKADLKEDGVAVISYGQIHAKINTGTTLSEALTRRVDSSFLETNSQCLLQKNDFIFADTSEDINGCGNCCFNDYDGLIFAGYHTVVAQPNNLQYPKYYAYLIQSNAWKLQIQTLVNGVKVYSINKGILKKSSLLIPTISEQQTIVSYLDTKVSKIDNYIATAEKKIAALDELKQVTIADAVTHGIKPNAPMKDSGSPWIGIVPEHWEIKRIAIIFSENKDKNSKYEFSHAFKFNYGTLVPKNEAGDVSEYRETYEAYTIIKKDDIAINCLNLNYDFVSQRVAISPNKGILTSAYLIITPRQCVNPYYYNYLFKSMDSKKMFHGMGTGIRLTLSYTELKKQFLPSPPLFEQNEIVAYIDHKVAQIDKVKASELAQIEKLKEYKQRLISDVVTGKVKVIND